MLGRLHPGLASSFSSTLIQLLLVTLQGAFQHRDNFTLRTVKICSHLVDQNSTVAVKLLTHVQLIVTPWTAAHQAALSFTISRSLFRLVSIESVMPANHLVLSFPSPPGFNLSQHQGLFPMSQLLASGASASASVLP